MSNNFADADIELAVMVLRLNFPAAGQSCISVREFSPKSIERNSDKLVNVSKRLT